MNVTLLMLATTRLPFPALQLGQEFRPRPTVKKRWWSMVVGTRAGYFLELRLRRDLVKLLATEVAFCGGGRVRIVGEEDSVPE